MTWPAPTDYLEAIQDPSFCFSDPELRDGVPSKDNLGLPRPISGGFACVFQINCKASKYAVRCFLRYHRDQEKRYEIINRHLEQSHLPCMVSFNFINKGIKVRGQWYPILKMEWIDGEPLNTYIEKNIRNPQVIDRLAERFLELVSGLRRSSIAHGDLQHGNILIVNGDIRLIDYDGMFVPGLEGMSSHEVGHPNYQHPLRSENHFGLYLDNFSAWVIYLSLEALRVNPNLWDRFRGGDENLLFRQKDFKNPDLSEVMTALKHIPNDTFQSLVSSFELVTYLDLFQIPPLDGAKILAHGTPQISASTQSEWLKDYIDFLPPSQRPPEESDSPGGELSWVMEQLIPISPVEISCSCIIERVLLVAYLIIVIILIYVTTRGIVPPILTVPIIGGGFALMALILILRFHFLPEGSKKYELLSERYNLQREIKQIEKAVKQMRVKKEKINEKQKSVVIKISEKQSENAKRERMEFDAIDQKLLRSLANTNSQRQLLNQSERKELDRINLDLKNKLTDLNARIQKLDTDEANEITQTLRGFQNKYLAPHLAKHDLHSAQISGIGPELKKRLFANGIVTAADIINIQSHGSGWGRYSHQTVYIEVPGKGPVHVEGIGPTKAQSLLSWRHDIESRLRKHISQSLPIQDRNAIRSKYEPQRLALKAEAVNAERNAAQQDASIKSKYRSKLQPLDAKDANFNKDAVQKKDEIRKKYQQERDKLDKELQSAQFKFTEQLKWLSDSNNLLPEKNWALSRVKRELEAYRKVNFPQYIRRILFFKNT